MPDTPCQSCDTRGWNIRDNRVEPCDCGTFADNVLRDLVTGLLRGYTGPPDVAADELIRMVRQWDARLTEETR